MGQSRYTGTSSGRCQGATFKRFPSHLNWPFPKWRSIGPNLSSSWVTELRALLMRGHPAMTRAHDHRRLKEDKTRKSRALHFDTTRSSQQQSDSDRITVTAASMHLSISLNHSLTCKQNNLGKRFHLSSASNPERANTLFTGP